MLRVLIADDHPIVRKGFRLLLEESNMGRKIVEAKSGEEAIALATKEDFDIALLDISMPGMDGIETTEKLRQIKPMLPVLIISIYPEKDYALRALKAGAYGYLTKQCTTDELEAAIRKVMRRERYVTPALAEVLTERVIDSASEPLHERLSRREFQVLKLILDGKSLKEISAIMSLSPKTIGTFKTRMLEKLNVCSTAELVKYALKHELFQAPKE